METPQGITLKVEGMTCTNCALGIEKMLRNKGLHNVQVSFAAGEVSFDQPENYSLEQVKRDIGSLGYQVVSETAAGQKPGLSPLEKKFIFSLIFTLPLLAHMVISWAPLHNPLLQLILSLPVLIIGIGHFGKSAYGSLKAGIPNMDVLITLGSVSAFIYSLWGTLLHWGTPEAHNYLFFETAATIITLVLMGNVLEQRSVKQAGSALNELARLQPAVARRIKFTPKGEETELVDSSLIVPGDLLRVNTGDSIPADGILADGQALINESMITGESLPAERQVGAQLTGGTVVEQGSFIMRATRTGADTALAGIIGLVKKAQAEKPPIQRVGDRVSAWFVPIVIVIAVGTFFISWLAFDVTVQNSLMRAIAVLVISCPCAMGLATPTAVMAGIGKAAKKGVLFRSGTALEELARIRTIVFDKTGTLTSGKFLVEKLEILDSSLSEEEAIALILGLESRSAHPLAKSLMEAFSGWGIVPAEYALVSEERGKGMEGMLADGRRVRLGSARFASVAGNTFDVYLNIDDKPVAGLLLQDEIRPGTGELMELLHTLNIRTVLLSGDSERKCRVVAEKLGIREVYSQKLPGEKLEIIRDLAAKEKTAMVGDGINDAPALNLASVGISLSSATQAAIGSSQVVLLDRQSVQGLANAVLIGRLTLQTIHQNLFWAFSYNIVAIPIAAVGLLNPMVAAFSMAFSDIIVIGNSIRLKYRKISNPK